MIVRAAKIPFACRFFFSEIQQHKPTPIQQRVQQEGIMAKKMLEKNYNIIGCTQNDSMQLIKHKFSQIKRRLNDRTYYMPNKKQFLLMLDHSYDQIMKVHADYNFAEFPRPTAISKKQQVLYQLEKIKRQRTFQLFQTYQFGALLLLIFIIFQVHFQQVVQKQTQRLHILRYFKLSESIKQSFEYLKKQFKQKVSKESPQQKKQRLRKLFQSSAVSKKLQIQKI